MTSWRTAGARGATRPFAFATITRDQRSARLDQASPDNDDRSEGFALVNVLELDQFERKRIPGSAHIPHGKEDALEQRFDKNEEIIVYCASPRCDASEKAARELASRGFERVLDYEAGMSDWRQAGHPFAGTTA